MAQRRQALLAAGQPVSEPSERVPAHVSNLGHPQENDALAASLQPYAGKKFRVAFDDIRPGPRGLVEDV